MDTLPGLDNWKPIVDTMKRGDYFVTSGEVLIPRYAVEGAGSRRTIVADVEWTFPLEFVEAVWGDGNKTDRQIIPATDLPPFGKKHFEIPFIRPRGRSGCALQSGIRLAMARSFNLSSCRARIA